jgi:hypothetical protein
MEDKIVTGVPPMPSQPDRDIRYYRDILGRIAEGWKTPATLAQFALDHEWEDQQESDEAKAKEPLSIWSCINCRKRVATACDFNINSRPNCVECNAEMEPFDDMKDKLKELEQDHNTAERARKRGLRTQPKPGEPGYQNKQE